MFCTFSNVNAKVTAAHFIQFDLYLLPKFISMRPFIAFVALLLVSFCNTNGYAQKCNFDVDETDPFTKETHKATELIRLSGVPRWWMKLEQKGENYLVTLHIFKVKEVRAVLAKDTKIMAKLEDGNTVEFTVENDVNPTVNVEQMAIIVSQWTAVCKTSKEDLSKLSKSPIAFMRTNIGGEEVNMPEVHDKGVNKVVKFAGCLLSAK